MHFGSKVLVTLSYVRICYYTNMPVTISVGEVRGAAFICRNCVEKFVTTCWSRGSSDLRHS